MKFAEHTTVFLFVFTAIFSSCNKDENIKLTTAPMSDISGTAATGGGNITYDGGSPVKQRGIVWNTTPNPTIENNLKSNGSGTGNYTINLNGLNYNTTYFVRAYATNSEKTEYGDQVTFTTTASEVVLNTNLTYGSMTDQDGNTYATIEIGSQKWMAENLKTTRYSNGDSILNIPGFSQLLHDTGAWFYYTNNSSNNSAYGKLYNWYAVSDPRNVCPNGWHVPTDTEWNELTDYLGGELVAGAKMKSMAGWNPGYSYINNSNESGFSGLPGGRRSTFYNFNFGNAGSLGYWWSSTEFSESNAWYRGLTSINNNSMRYSTYKSDGFSVRCLKD